MTNRYKLSTTEELIEKMKLFEDNSTIQDINKSQYIDILNELYSRDPHTYFRKWYFFKTQSKVTFEDWEKWGKFCDYLDAHYTEKDKIF